MYMYVCIWVFVVYVYIYVCMHMYHACIYIIYIYINYNMIRNHKKIEYCGYQFSTADNYILSGCLRFFYDLLIILMIQYSM